MAAQISRFSTRSQRKMIRSFSAHGGSRSLPMIFLGRFMVALRQRLDMPGFLLVARTGWRGCQLRACPTWQEHECLPVVGPK
jgi:hypothetical protein